MDAQRTPLVVANWKMHKTIPEALRFLDAFLPALEGLRAQGAPGVGRVVEVAIAPPFTALQAVGARLRSATASIGLAAQNVHPEPQGAYTGEVSPVMLSDLGCRYVIVGHSERRRHFGEDDAFINKKLLAALRHGLGPILCVGETLEERRAGRTQGVLERQLRGALAGCPPEGAERLVIAYEPVWAIGTGVAASPDDAQEGARFVRELLRELYGEAVAGRVRVQYGGSVQPGNAYELMVRPDVDGALVGGASLDPEQFAQIVAEAAKAVQAKG